MTRLASSKATLQGGQRNRMRSYHAMRGPWPWFIAITAFVLLFSTYLLLHAGKKPVAPEVPVVSGCKKLGPGMRRIGRFGFQFDIPVEGYTITNFDSDAPPVYGFRLRPPNSGSFLDLSWGPEVGIEGMRPAVDPALIFSGPVENRKILDDAGNPVGEDSWGYWDNREFWRRVRLRGSVVARYGPINRGDVASYGSVHQREAELFDQIINSACIGSSPAP